MAKKANHIAALGIGFLLAATTMPHKAEAREDLDEGLRHYDRGDYQAAIAAWLGPASHGDASSLFNLGQMYRLGKGVPVDVATAIRYYEQASVLGHANAQTNLGALYYFSENYRNLPRAIALFRIAARAGQPRAQYMLGVSYYNGDAVTRDYLKAYAYTKMAADSGVNEAKEALDKMENFIPVKVKRNALELVLSIKAGKNGLPEPIDDLSRTSISTAMLTSEKATPGYAVQTQIKTSAAQKNYPPLGQVQQSQNRYNAYNQPSAMPQPVAPQRRQQLPYAQPPQVRQQPMMQSMQPPPPPYAQQATRQTMTQTLPPPEPLPQNYSGSQTYANQPTYGRQQGFVPSQQKQFAPPSNGWVAQIGSFSSLSRAQQAWTRFSGRFGKHQNYYQNYEGRVRLQVGPFASSSKATSFCRSSGVKGCFVLRAQ